MIVYNAIRCNNCNEIIQSKYIHDFVKCKCGQCAVDGGNMYPRRMGKDYTELSLDSDNTTHEQVREVFSWGQNYNKEKELLPKTNWILLKNIDDEYLATLVDYTKDRDRNIYNIFVREQEYRRFMNDSN